MKKRILLAFLTVIMLFSISIAVYGAEGWQNEEGNWYYYRNDTKVLNEWLDDNDKKYYLGSDGKMAVGLHIRMQNYHLLPRC